MIKVEGGTFFMGSSDSDATAEVDEQKKHEVTINSFEISKFEVTVWEWCWDWYNKDYYKIENGKNPKGPESGEKKCVRGGSWDSQPNYVRPANRISTAPEKTHEFYGFRIVKSIVQ